MGGCCCCLQKDQSDQTPLHAYIPQDLEELEHGLSASRGRSSALPTGVLVNTNLDISTPDTLLEPPRFVPSMGLPHSQTLSRNVESGKTNSDIMHPADPERCTQVNGTTEGSDRHWALGQPLSKVDGQYDSPQKIKEKDRKSISSATDDDDGCPICLEEYDFENPRILTKCNHHYHLSCILEWMERSETCPICDKIMMLDDDH